MDHALNIVTGAAGVGKSTFGRKLAAKHGAVFLDSDTVSEAVVRAGMQAAGLDPTDRDSPEYKRTFRDAVYDCLFAAAAENLKHLPVVIVGPFTRELQDGDWPKSLHTRLGVVPTVWFLTCADEIRHERIQQRSNPRDQAKLDHWEAHVASCQNVRPAFPVEFIDTGDAV